jgi:hypothetical protein
MQRSQENVLRTCGHYEVISIPHRDHEGFKAGLLREQSRLCRECWHIEHSDPSIPRAAISESAAGLHIVSVWHPTDLLKKYLIEREYLLNDKPLRFVAHFEDIADARAEIELLRTAFPAVIVHDHVSELWLSDVAKENHVTLKYLKAVAEALQIAEPLDVGDYERLSVAAQLSGNENVARQMIRSIKKRRRGRLIETAEMNDLERMVFAHYLNSPPGKLPSYKLVADAISPHLPGVDRKTIQRVYYKLKNRVRHARDRQKKLSEKGP